MGDGIPVRHIFLIFVKIKSSYGHQIIKTISFLLGETILIIGQTDKTYFKRTVNLDKIFFFNIHGEHS